MADDDLFPSIDDEDIDTFPILDIGDEFLQEDEEGEEPPIPYGITWKFDFNGGDLHVDNAGQFLEVSEKETLQQWISHQMNTWRWETPIFSGDIGTEIHNLIGARTTIDGGTLARVEEEILTSVKVHDRIEEVGVVVLIPAGYDIFAVFKYTTDDAAVNTEVASL